MVVGLCFLKSELSISLRRELSKVDRDEGMSSNTVEDKEEEEEEEDDEEEEEEQE